MVPTIPPNDDRWLAARGGGPNIRTGERLGQAHQHAGHLTVRGFWCLCPLWIKSPEGEQVQVICTHGQRVRHEGIAGTCDICAVACIISNFAHCTGDAGCSVFSITACIRDDHRAFDKDLSISLAPHLLSRRAGTVFTLEPFEVKDGHGCKSWERCSFGMGPKTALGLHLQPGGDGRQFLAATGHLPSSGLDCAWKPREAEDTSRAIGSWVYDWRSQCDNSTSGRGKSEDRSGFVRDARDASKEHREKTKRWR